GGGAGAHGDRAGAHPRVGGGDGLGRDFPGCVGRGGHAETRRYPFTGCGHLAQVCGLAADEVAHVATSLVQVDDGVATSLRVPHWSGFLSRVLTARRGPFPWWWFDVSVTSHGSCASRSKHRVLISTGGR